MVSTAAHRERGFGLIELLVLIVLVGIVASVALQSMTRVTRDVRTVTTEREMEMLAEAMVGNPELTQAGIRSDFGYVGDIGAFPPNIAALVSNPGGWSTWNGPYTRPGFTPNLSEVTTDAWGAPYQYAGGAVIVSTGGGSSLTHRLADSTSDYLRNRLLVTIADTDDNPPGPVWMDSVKIQIRVPNGAGGWATRTVHPDSMGLAVLDTLPVGCHRLDIIFAPDADTLGRYVTVLPRNKNTGEVFKFGGAIFGGASLSPGIAGEVGVVSDNQANGSEWHPVTFVNSYSDPVVVMRGMSHNGLSPAHLRVKAVTPLGFSWQIEEWDYLGGSHVTEQCPYMVVEAGTHVLEDGTKIEAGTVSCTDAWTTVTFPSGFTSMPVLLTGVATADDPAACVTRTRNLSTNGFEIRLQEEEAADDVHGVETVSWIAVEQGAGVNNGVAFIANQTANAVRHTLYQITFSPSFSSAPVFLCQDDTYDDNDPCATRYAFLSGSSVRVRIEEEMSQDIDFWHSTERVSWLAWGQPSTLITMPGL